MSNLIRQVLDPVTADPYLAGHGDPSYDVDHYDLTLDYKLEGNQLNGKARIQAVAREDIRQLTLDLETLRASKVSVPGVGVAKHAHRRGKLVVTLKSPVSAGTPFTVGVTYGGNPRPTRSKAGESGWEELSDGVLVAGQPAGAPTWFPCNDRPASKATYRFTITAPTGYHVVANGERTSRRLKASGVTWVYEQRAPMASYLATLQIGRYVAQQLATEPVRQQAVVPPALQKRLGGAFGEQASMMRLFIKRFGPYPFDDYTVVITADELEIPLEAQGLSIFGSNFLGTDWETVRLVAHELAHQWFGNSLTASNWSDIWLHEGFACYAEWLWSEDCRAASTRECAAEAHKRLRALPQDIMIGNPGPELMFDDRVYKRGALTLHAIRRSAGDRAFFDLLKSWVKAHRHGSVSTAGFVEFARQQIGRDVVDLCDRWLYRKALPDLP